MTLDKPSAPVQPSGIRSITIFTVLVIASISGAAVAQLTADPVPLSIGQPDAVATDGSSVDGGETIPDPLAFGD